MCKNCKMLANLSIFAMQQLCKIEVILKYFGCQLNFSRFFFLFSYGQILVQMVSRIFQTHQDPQSQIHHNHFTQHECITTCISEEEQWHQIFSKQQMVDKRLLTLLQLGNRLKNKWTTKWNHGEQQLLFSHYYVKYEVSNQVSKQVSN